MGTTFDLTRANVKKITCTKDYGAYDLKKVVDMSGNVLWQSSIPTYLSNCYFYTSKTEDTTGSYPGIHYNAAYSLYDEDAGTLLGTNITGHIGTVTERRFYRNPNTGKTVYVGNGDLVSFAYEGWYYGCLLTFSGYESDDGDVYDPCSYTLLSTELVHGASGYEYLLTKTSTGYTAYLDERLYTYSNNVTWFWYIKTNPESVMNNIVVGEKHGGTSSSVTFSELRSVVAGTELAGKTLYVYCEISIDTGEIDENGYPVTIWGQYYSNEGFESYTEIAIPKAVTRTYDGTAQYGCEAGDGYTRSGKGTNAGSHTTTVSLKSGYIWSDGTTSDKTIKWTMKKASFTKVELRLGTSSPYYVQWRVNGPNCAADKSFTVKWSISNTNGNVTQPRATGNESYTASANGNLVENNTGTYTSKNPSDYKYYGSWEFAGSTNFNAFKFTCSKSNAKKLQRGTYITIA